MCRGVAGSSGLPAWAFSRCPAVTGCSSCGRSIGWEGSFDSSDPSPSLCSCIHPALLHLDGFPGPNERLAAALLNQEPRLSSLLNQSFKCVSLTESTLFLSFFFFFPVQSNVGFCFSPPHNKIKTISNRRTCRKESFFLPSAASCLGVKGAGITFLLARTSLGSWVRGTRKRRVRKGKGGHPGCSLVMLMKAMVLSIG